MPHQHLAVLAILNTLITIRNSVMCSTASATSPLLILGYGDMDHFMKLLQRYQTSSELLFPSKEDDQGTMGDVFQNMAMMVCLAVIYMYRRNECYKNLDILQSGQRFSHILLFRTLSS